MSLEYIASSFYFFKIFFYCFFNNCILVFIFFHILDTCSNIYAQVAVYDLKAHPLPMHVGETVLKYDQSAHLITLK